MYRESNFNLFVRTTIAGKGISKGTSLLLFKTHWEFCLKIIEQQQKQKKTNKKNNL